MNLSDIVTKKCINPPRFAGWILSRLTRFEDEFAISDLVDEEYFHIRKQKGKIAAFVWYWMQVFVAFFQYSHCSLYWSIAMLKNYIMVTCRTMLKQKGYSAINILGLAVGMTVCILILLYVNFELSYDKFHKNSDQIYRLCTKYKIGESYRELPRTSGAVPTNFQENLSEVKSYVRIMDMLRFSNQTIVNYKDDLFEETGMLMVDTNFFDFFSFRLIKGDPKTCLSKPGTVVINEKTAKKLFGNKNPIGEVIHLDVNVLDGNFFEITGIMQDVQKNSHFDFNYLFGMPSASTFFANQLNSWDASRTFFNTYLLFEKNANVLEIEQRMNHIFENNMTDRRGVITDITIYLQKLTDIHLKSNLSGELGVNSDIKIVYSLTALAFFILIIVCINFMNLVTAQSVNRVREVGMRKVLGASKRQLVRQFIGESVIFSLISFAISIFMVILLLPVFNTIANTDLSLTQNVDSNVVLTILIILFTTGVAAGSYPAFYLSSFRPIVTLKGISAKYSRNSFFGKTLIIFQFTISIALIASTIIVHNQIRYMKSKNLGFEMAQTLVVRPKAESSNAKREVIRDTFLQNPQVLEAALSSSVPGSRMNVLYAHPEGFDEENRQIMKILAVDNNFLDFYKIELLEGRQFSTEFGSDIQTCIINETAVKTLGWENRAIGKIIRSEYHDNPELKVVGVIRDFHQHALDTKIQPMIIFPYPNNNYPIYISLNIKTDDIAGTISSIETEMDEFEPGYDIEYFFLDDNFNSLYHQEVVLGKMFSYISAIAILMACLGLIGLAAYITEQSRKEISIRKILGASEKALVYKLSRSFLANALIANIIAGPISYFVIEKFWLINFPYRISINLWTFILTGFISIIMVFLSVSYHSAKAVYANPADNLRAE